VCVLYLVMFSLWFKPVESVSCLAGQDDSVVSGTCASCAPNRYKASSGTAACTSCPPNSWSAAGEVTCTPNAGFVRADDKLLAYYAFKAGIMYADNTGNGYTLTSTNGASYAPALDSTSAPFSGAGVVVFDNNAVTVSLGTGKTFKISLGTGWNLYSMIGTSASPGPGFTLCAWYRVKDGVTPGVANTVEYWPPLASSVATLPMEMGLLGEGPFMMAAPACPFSRDDWPAKVLSSKFK
jgi:hypothetical protein